MDDLKTASPSVRHTTSSALEAAIENGDIDFLFQLFASTARDLAQTGQGKQLIKLSRFAGDDSIQGLALRKAFTFMGHLVELDFETVNALANELDIEKDSTQIADFLQKMIALVRAYVTFSQGDLKAAHELSNYCLTSPVLTNDLDSVDKPGLVRLQALIAHLYSDLPALTNCLSKVDHLISEFGGTNISHHQLAIRAIKYYEEGNFLKSFEIAKSGISAATANGYVGFAAPLDCQLIVAKSLFEFSKLDLALLELEELKTEAKACKSTLYYVLAETFAIRILAAQSNITAAMDRLNLIQQEISSVNKMNDIAWLIDVTELYIRYILGDKDRCAILIARSPDVSYVRQVKAALFDGEIKAESLTNVQKLPEQTYRQQIYKYLYLAEFKSHDGQTPKKYMKKALAVGELVGSREMFIRQLNLHVNLILEIAKEEPSAYLEELARDCIKRQRERAEKSILNSENLTKRELEVLKHLAMGKSIDGIGKALHISKNTMKTHLRNIYRKLAVAGRVEAVKKGESLLLI